ncbi:uncharacterized protein M6B38_333990 [Iris pallida]|uniref:COP1-interacting protein 7 n=1 Tax=Iris pallida TaxID=29817 RepID=A0AAX6H0Y9_IRIPA|nr:uncharacterized protein M6B38_333990 [Iris pallida]
MKSHTQLEVVVFQLTPTRTRYDLVIIANGKTEKLSSGLLDPFLAHLRTAQDQIAKGGYSIRLEPKSGTDAVWFTKGTVERFIRYVSSPDVLERVNTLEAEILQINEAIAIQGNNSLGLGSVEDHQKGWKRLSEGNRCTYNANKEKAGILFKNGSRRRLSMGPIMQEDNSRLQLLKVLETRKTALLKEQGMAFARAMAAGFDIDHITNLELFAKSFGASRLLKACLRFMELWKAKHKTGEWIEIAGVEVPFQSEAFPMKVSGIMLSEDIRERKELTESCPLSNYDFSTETKGNATQQFISDHFKDKRRTSDPQIPGPQYYRGQSQNPMFHQWASHSQPGPPSSQLYPTQGMPYYQNYPGCAPSLPDKGTSHGRVSHKRDGHSGKKQSYVVVENPNHKTLEGHHRSASESQSASDADTEELHDLQYDAPEGKHKPSRSNSEPSKSTKTSITDEKNKVIYGQEEDGGNWQTFQNLLLRVQSEGTRIGNREMFSSEKESPVKKRTNKAQADPIVSRERVISDAQKLLEGNRVDAQFREIEGGANGYRRTGKDDSVVRSEMNKNMSTRVSGFVAEDEYENASYLNKTSLNDESFVVPLRSGLHDEHVADKKGVIDSTLQRSKANSTRTKMQDNYEPNDMTMLPRRGLEKGSTSFDLSKDLDMQIPVRIRNGMKTETRSQKPVSKLSQEGLNRSEMEKKPTTTKYALEKRKMDAMARSGKSSKVSPLAEAKARAEKLRAFKADLQRVKKEREEEERKRLETLKMERQKRIAARSSSNITQTPLNAQQKKAREPTRLSPNSCSSSKFSDAPRTTPLPLRKLPISGTSTTRSSLKPQQTKMTTRLSLSPYRNSKVAATLPVSSSLQRFEGNSRTAQSTSNSQETTARKQTHLSPGSYRGSRFSSTAASFSSPLQRLPSGTSSASSSFSPKTTKTNRLAVSTYKGSKFSDTEPSPSTGLRNLPTRTTASCSSTSNEISNINRLNGRSPLFRNVPGRMVTPGHELRKDGSNLTNSLPKAKGACVQTKRMSDSNGSDNHHALPRSVISNQVSKAAVQGEPQEKKTLANLLPLDKIRVNSLPGNKIRTSGGPSRVVAKDTVVRTRRTTLTSEKLQAKKSNAVTLSPNDDEDDPIVEKTVVMLETKMTSAPVAQASGEMVQSKQTSSTDGKKEKIELVSGYAVPCNVVPTVSQV